MENFSITELRLHALTQIAARLVPSLIDGSRLRSFDGRLRRAVDAHTAWTDVDALLIEHDVHPYRRTS